MKQVVSHLRGAHLQNITVTFSAEAKEGKFIVDQNCVQVSGLPDSMNYREITDLQYMTSYSSGFSSLRTKIDKLESEQGRSIKLIEFLRLFTSKTDGSERTFSDVAIAKAFGEECKLPIQLVTTSKGSQQKAIDRREKAFIADVDSFVDDLLKQEGIKTELSQVKEGRKTRKK